MPSGGVRRTILMDRRNASVMFHFSRAPGQIFPDEFSRRR
ncbi:hypothetical protein FBZ84_111104 [Azospirillum baldaniorum]|nr:hypothetical protein FBZ84_111104 [Azospirillum baldaniorum]